MSSDVSRRDKQSLHYIIRSGLAGGIAGCVAKTAVAPLDRVKILFQASNPDFAKYAGTWSGAFRAGTDIYRDRGIRGLLQGHSATLLRVFPYAAIKFMAYDQMHHILMPTKQKETNFRRFAAGALSGMTSVFFTYPLELIRIRMAFQTKSVDKLKPANALLPPSFLRAFSEIYHERGIASHSATLNNNKILTQFPLLRFYRGFSVTLAGMIPYAGGGFLCWGYLHELFPTSDGKKHSPFADLIMGGVSGAVSQTASYPFEVVRRRMQVGGLTNPNQWLRWGETVRSVYNSGGWRGFYVGLSIGFLKVVPMTAVSFTVWKAGKRLLHV